MPELAEVEFYRKQWNDGLGHTIKQVHIHPAARIFRDCPAAEFVKLLPHTKLLQSYAHGKQMLFAFNNDVWLSLHLGMTGKLLTATPEIVPAKSEHLVLVQTNTALVFSDYRMFGRVTIEQSKGFPKWWKDLPPKINSRQFTRKRFYSILQHHPKAPLKAVLLNQSYFPGIGNWMADEILWQTHIHPASRSANLNPREKETLFNAIKSISKDALRIIAPNWGDLPDSWLFNHRWKNGGICPISKKPLVRETIAGRTTCFSPAIQIIQE